MHAATTRVATLAPINWWLFARQMARLLWIVIRWRPQIMHQPITDRVSFWKEGAFMLAARLFGLRIVGHLHGNQFAHLATGRRPLMRWSVRRVMRLPAVIIALSEGWRSLLLEHIAPDLNVVVIPNTVGADFAAFAAEGEPSVADGTPDHPFRALFVGSLGTRKGVPELLAAARLVREQVPDAQFVLAGALELGAERELMERARAAPPDGVTFPGVVTGPEKVALFASADVFVLPSHQENFPIAVLEAMAAGLPLVVTPVGALPEVLQEGRNCHFVVPGDSQALAARLVHVAQHPGERCAMGITNQRLFRQAFAPDVVLAQIEAVYAGLLGLLGGDERYADARGEDHHDRRDRTDRAD